MVVQEHSTATNMKRASHFTPRCNQMQLVLSMRREAKNDEARMTNAEGIPNDEIRNSDDEACLFGIPASSFVIRHSSFVISISSHLPRSCCTIMILREGFSSVRGYGLRAYEPRQGRNAATVV